jgi:hydroxyethylthiazole kinase-like uncharacterized protein yjeF
MPGREILTTQEVRAADRAAISQGTPGFELMLRAGRSVAREIAARWTPRPVLVLCGPGANGGDGYICAKTLQDGGWPVRVASLAQTDKLKGDAALAFDEWAGPVESLGGRVFEGAGLIVDALFGAGLDRPLEARVQTVLRAAERTGAPIVAVDLPSGLSGDLGRPLGHACHAALTVTFHRKKPAHVLVPGREHCGEVVVADIGLAAPREAMLHENGPELWAGRLAWPGVASHKHARGRLVVVSGEAFSTGAARLSARAGLRIGAGLVTLLSPAGDAALINGAHLEAVMLRTFETDLEVEAAAAQVDAAIIGPGAGVNENTVSNLFALARTGAGLVIDADALTVFKDDPDELFQVLDRDDVLTPHPGEFERIFKGLLASAPERIAAARQAAERAGAVVLLKGSDTVIAAPDGRAVVSGNGSPWLATAGSGDVLAGFIGGLIAQGLDSFDAACAAVWMHAEAATAFGPGLIAEDLPAQVTGVLRQLYAARDR